MSERPSARLSSERILVRSDSDIKRDVEDELKWDPEIMDPTDIAVSVKDGVVTLAGFARRYIDKWEAEWAAKRVQGVVGIANDIEVRLPDADERPDPEIARDAVASIKLQLPEAWENITVIVRDAWVTLQGHVEWQYQREADERAVHPIKGVKSISNLIRIEPKVAPSEVKRKIEEAFKRSAELDARRITIEVVGNEVILRGTVRSWSEYAEAERAAWAAPGVVNVTNELVVEA
ncbi:MAG: BON domain-containing protein [Methyloceanibacter sp.]|jgi:osmotically-inducible protein OsmY